jgi:hypothetical protein
MPPRKLSPVTCALKELTKEVVGVEEGKNSYAVLKEILQLSPEGARSVYRELSAILFGRAKGSVKLRALDVFDNLFRKSRDFRSLICSELRDFVSRCCNRCEGNVKDINKNPIALFAISLLGKWDQQFGEIYPPLRAMARFYKETVKILGPTGTLRVSCLDDNVLKCYSNILVTNKLGPGEGSERKSHKEFAICSSKRHIKKYGTVFSQLAR